MYLEDMSKLQQAEESIFVDTLSQAGWDATDASGLLHAGVWVHPEGIGFFSTQKSDLELEFHAEEQAFVLNIISKDTHIIVRLKIHYGENIQKILAWVTTHAEEFTIQSFAKLLKEVYLFCEQVFLVDDEGNHHSIQLSDGLPQTE